MFFAPSLVACRTSVARVGGVRSSNGAPGVDRITLDQIEYGIDRLLDELAGELREGRYGATAAAGQPRGVEPLARRGLAPADDL